MTWPAVLAIYLSPSGAIIALIGIDEALSAARRRRARSAEARQAAARATARTARPDPGLSAVRDAIRRAELRERGVTPIGPRDPEREALEDRLLAFVRTARGEATARKELYPTSGRDVIALPVKRDGGAVRPARRHDPQGEAS
jgi:hypothetical protein